MDDRLREQVWPVLSGATLLQGRSKKSFENYSFLSQLPQACGEDAYLHKDVVQLELDLRRSNAVLKGMKLKNDQIQGFKASIKRVLLAFCQRNQDIGYVQGHQNIVAVLLTLLNRNEEKTFWVFCALCEVILGKEYYARNPRLKGFQQDVKRLKAALKRTLPKDRYRKLCDTCDLENITLLLSLEWLLTLYTDHGTVRLEVLKVFFDNLFLSFSGCHGRISNRQLLQKVMHRARKQSFKGAKALFHLQFAVALIKDCPMSSLLSQKDSPADEEYSQRDKKRMMTANVFERLKKYASSTSELRCNSIVDSAYSIPPQAFQVAKEHPQSNAEVKDPMSPEEARALIAFSAKFVPRFAALVDYPLFRQTAKNCSWTSKKIVRVFAAVDPCGSGVAELYAILYHLLSLCDSNEYSPSELEKLASALYYELDLRNYNKLNGSKAMLDSKCQCITM